MLGTSVAMSNIRKKDELEEFFHRCGKPREQWRVGTEYEKVGIERASGRAISYSGQRGVEAILKALVEQYDWQPQEEEGRVIGLRRGKAEVHLEPGGQIELSGEPCEDIHCTRAEFTQHIREMVDVAERLDVAFLGLGMQPVSPMEEIEWVPKKRYRIMAPYMGRVGTMGHRMMKQTATVQANIDYSDERDAMAKFRTAMGISPLVTAIFANSPISEGVPNGYKSFRQHIWTRTDSDRCGLLRFAFSPNVTFAHYVEYALDVPMYFVIRDGNYIDFTGIPFRHFLAHGYKGHIARMEDWELHLTTLFPEVRIKRYMEVRSADSQAPDLMPALPALYKGVLYESDCLEAAWDLVKGWSWDERMEIYHDSHRYALRARIRRFSLLDLAIEFFHIAWEGLKRQWALNSDGEDETIYLRPLQEILHQGKCPADLLEDRWEGEMGQDFRKLIEYSAYKQP
ncbi:MAG: glutamate--cysteine ligase [Candidatus Binatia bacterium]